MVAPFMSPEKLADPSLFILNLLWLIPPGPMVTVPAVTFPSNDPVVAFMFPLISNPVSVAYFKYVVEPPIAIAGE